MNFITSIQGKIILALTFLAVLIIGSTVALNKIYSSNISITSNKSNLHSLATSIQTLERNNKNYIQNAPRDYESYNRDVQVFHATLLQDIQTIDETAKQLSEASKITSLAFFVGDHFNKIVPEITKVQQDWELFKSGLNEQLGNIPKEPRLEWGAEFITEQAPALGNSFQSLITQYDAISSEYALTSKTISNGLIIALAVSLAVFALWLFSSVIRPIKSASEAFKTVTAGDYGLQIPEKRNDEIGDLIHSFNSLSSRTELVLSILSELQNSNHPTKAVESLHQLSSSYLDANFVSVLQVDNDYSKARYSFSSPKDEYKELSGKIISLHPGSDNDKFLNQLQDRQAFLINDISSFIQANADSELVRVLSKHSILQSLILLPLQTDKWQGLLVIASHKLDHFSQSQLELMDNLSPLIAKGISSSLIRAKAFSKLKAVNA